MHAFNHYVRGNYFSDRLIGQLLPMFYFVIAFHFLQGMVYICQKKMV